MSLESIAGWHELGVPHAAAAVITPEGVAETFGDTARQFYLASVTKPFAAAAILLGVEEGAVSLEDEAGPPGATLRHLLAHTAGYAFESDGPVISRPGARRIYSNRGIEEAAAHLERAAGIPFADYLGEAVFQPLGLAATELRGSPAFAGWTTVDDLTRFAAELLTPALLAPETVAEMATVQFPGLTGVLPGHGKFDPLDWGLGVERNFGRERHWSGTAVSREAFGHFGGSGTFLWVDPVRRLAAVCLTDRDFDAWARTAWPLLCTAIVTEHGAA